jgi:hypothetical protein
MTRDGLEYIIWRKAIQLTAPRPADRQAAMDAILNAADIYAAAEHAAPPAAAALTVRQARNQCRAVHLDDPGATGRPRPACRVVVRHHQPMISADPAAVTCHSCLATAAYGTAVLGVAS